MNLILLDNIRILRLHKGGAEDSGEHLAQARDGDAEVASGAVF